MIIFLGRPPPPSKNCLMYRWLFICDEKLPVVLWVRQLPVVLWGSDNCLSWCASQTIACRGVRPRQLPVVASGSYNCLSWCEAQTIACRGVRLRQLPVVVWGSDNCLSLWGSELPVVAWGSDSCLSLCEVQATVHTFPISINYTSRTSSSSNIVNTVCQNYQMTLWSTVHLE